jgi:hypothetical protein
MSDKDWVKLSLDSTYFVAGERLTGEVLTALSNSDFKILLKSQGFEKVTLSKPSLQPHTFPSPIFTISEELLHSNCDLSQAVLPFSFKIPHFSPATFAFSDTDENNTTVHVEVAYSISVEFYKNDVLFIKEEAAFTVLNRNSRVVMPPRSEFSTEIKSCVCVPRGLSQISVEHTDTHLSQFKDANKYKISISSQLNAQLVSIVGQIIFEIAIRLPGETPIMMQKLVSRTVPSVEQMKKDSPSLDNLIYSLEADISTSGIGGNLCSNRTPLFSSDFKLDVLGIYEIGCRSKKAECQLAIHVNPTPSKRDRFELPNSWTPVELPLQTFIATTNEAMRIE